MPPEPSRAVERLTKLVAIDTQNTLCSGEAVAAGYIAAELTAAGLAVETPEAAPDRPNVVARPDNGDGPAIALNTHMDVVPAGEGWSGNPFDLREGADGRLYGRGACDAKGSLDVAHKPDEFVPLDELVAASLIYRDIVVAIAARR
jgi:succinyl-diaminopimelate desuccinylase